MTHLLVAWGLLGCVEPPVEGTFVGNPSLLARYVDNVEQVGLGGRLVTVSTALEPCHEATIPVGPQVFDFEGTSATVTLTLPPVELCGIRMSVTELAIEADDAGAAKTVVGQDFDLWVPSEIIGSGANRLDLRLGDETWLPGFLALAAPGLTMLDSEADPALRTAFYQALDDTSAFDAVDFER